MNEPYKGESFRKGVLIGAKDERNKTMARIGFLRQWLNERLEDRLITNKDIEFWLYLDK